MPEAHGAEEVVGVVEAHGFAHREGREVHVRLEVHTVFGVRRRLAEVAEVRLEARVVQRLRVVEGQELLKGRRRNTHVKGKKGTKVGGGGARSEGAPGKGKIRRKGPRFSNVPARE